MLLDFLMAVIGTIVEFFENLTEEPGKIIKAIIFFPFALGGAYWAGRFIWALLRIWFLG